MMIRDARLAGNTHQNQRGSSRAGFVIGLLLVLAIGTMGLTYKNDNPKAPVRPAPDKDIQAAIDKAQCVYRDPYLCKFFAVRAVQKEYTATTITEASGQKTTAVLKRHSDDTYYLKIDGNSSTELINIGTIRYTKTADGSWQKSRVAQDEALASATSADSALPEPVEYNDGTKATYQFVKAEPCAGDICRKYQVSDPASPGTTRFLWFTRDDYRLYRLQTITNGSGTTTYYDLASVSIAPPAPIAVAPPPPMLVQTGDTLPRTGDE